MVTNLKAEYSHYSRIATAFVGKSIRVIDVPDDNKDEVGFTTARSYICVNTDHPIMDGLSDEEKSAFRMGVFAHELLHKLLSDFSIFALAENHFLESELGIFLQLNNIMEDPAIEYLGRSEIGGDLMSALRFSIAHIYDKTPPIESYDNAFSQFIAACIQFGDMGALKGRFTEKQAKDIFRKAAPIIDKCIEEPDPRQRYIYATDVFELTRPMWQCYADMNELMSKIADVMEKNGKTGKREEGEAIIKPRSSSGNPSGNKNANQLRKRRKTILVLMDEEDMDEASGKDDKSNDASTKKGSNSNKADENEEMDNTEGTDTSGGNDEIPEEKSVDASDENEKQNKVEDGDGEGKEKADVKESESEEVTDKTDTDNDSDSTDDSGNGDSENEKDTDGSDNDSSASQDSANNSNAEGKMPDLDYESDPGDGQEYGDVEITEEEYEIPVSVLESIMKKIESEKRILENSVEEKNTNDETPINPVISSPLFVGNITCENRVIQLPQGSSEAMVCEQTYYGCLSRLSYLISTMTNNLKRVFMQDNEEYVSRCSGRIDMKKVCSGKVTAKLFNKKKDPANKKDMVLAILIDQSGSMQGQKIAAARDVAIVMTEVFGKLGIPVYVMGFSEQGGGRTLHEHYVRWKNTPKERMKLININARGCNFDGYSIRYITDVLKQKEATHKLLMVLSDGAPASSHYCGSQGVHDTYNAVREAKKISSVIGVGIGECKPEVIRTVYEKDFLHINNVEEMTGILVKTIQKIVSKWE